MPAPENPTKPFKEPCPIGFRLGESRLRRHPLALFEQRGFIAADNICHHGGLHRGRSGCFLLPAGSPNPSRGRVLPLASNLDSRIRDSGGRQFLETYRTQCEFSGPPPMPRSI